MALSNGSAKGLVHQNYKVMSLVSKHGSQVSPAKPFPVKFLKYFLLLQESGKHFNLEIMNLGSFEVALSLTFYGYYP